MCRQATLLDPDYAEAWALMALAQLDLRFVHGQKTDALPAAERALELNPDLAEAHCIKARYLEEQGKADEAEQQMRTALKLNPESWEVNREVARMLFRHDHIPESIPYFEKAASLMDADWSSPMMLTTCYESIEDRDKLRTAAKMTLERIERALAKDPTNGTALAAGAYSMAMFGDKERAREWMQRALVLDPDNLNMRYNLACTMVRQLGDLDETLNTLEPFFEQVSSATIIRHLEVDPDLDPIRGDQRFRTMLAGAKKRLGITDTAPAAEMPPPSTAA